MINKFRAISDVPTKTKAVYILKGTGWIIVFSDVALMFYFLIARQSIGLILYLIFVTIIVQVFLLVFSYYYSRHLSARYKAIFTKNYELMDISKEIYSLLVGTLTYMLFVFLLEMTHGYVWEIYEYGLRLFVSIFLVGINIVGLDNIVRRIKTEFRAEVLEGVMKLLPKCVEEYISFIDEGNKILADQTMEDFIYIFGIALDNALERMALSDKIDTFEIAERVFIVYLNDTRRRELIYEKLQDLVFYLKRENNRMFLVELARLISILKNSMVEKSLRALPGSYQQSRFIDIEYKKTLKDYLMMMLISVTTYVIVDFIRGSYPILYKILMDGRYQVFVMTLILVFDYLYVMFLSLYIVLRTLSIWIFEN